jgi:uncharacterized protein with NRDE domain
LVLYRRPNDVLAISGNRNESLKRPASGPRLENGVLAPRDEAAHGTWLGLNRHGLFVCVTNRRGGVIDARRPSRGLLVRDALSAESAVALHKRLRDLDGDRYNGFHLVYADLRDAFVTWSDGFRLAQQALSPEEVHVVTERSFGAGEGDREVTVRAAFAARPLDVRAWRTPMTAHAKEPLESACVHAEAAGYGTRSSLQLIVHEKAASMLWTDGHPCTNPSQDFSAAATTLLAGPPRAATSPA